MLRSLRISLRFLLPLLLAILAVAYLSIPLVDSLMQRWFVRDLDIRAGLIARSFEEPVSDLVESKTFARLDSLLERATTDERLFALALCDAEGRLLHKTRSFPPSIDCSVRKRARDGVGFLLQSPQGPLHVSTADLKRSGTDVATLVMLHDMSFVQRRSEDTRKYILLLFTGLGVVVALITIAVAHVSWRGWIAGVRAMLRGDGVIRPFSQPSPELQPLVPDLRALLRDLENERSEQDAIAVKWSPQALRRLLDEQFAGDEVVVVSNREPYIHVKSEQGIQMQRPASGLVTAVEPVMRACAGTWIAHGSGSADRESADSAGRLRVPPDDPSYTLRRVWLSEEEEQGYYYGLANEGLWPLCHIAHVRPTFRTNDWNQYVAVNRKFADAVAQEVHSDDPIVLIQDYHFALLPQLVRKRLPRATIITFWHIPWPNPESFGICPWRSEIINGLLGSTILGFHTRYHCNNFLQTVDRFLEARIEYESSTVSFGGHLTRVEAYPISIAWPDTTPNDESTEAVRARIRRGLGVDDAQVLGLGVDRLDYTKGIIERLRSVERFFELYPKWVGRFSLVQIAAPSRSSLEDYLHFEQQVRRTADEINNRFGRNGWLPIRLLIEHHSESSVRAHYRACDVCMVTSLHDGMNLVAKEFVAARKDERGVLILSQFAGAARELNEALIVNPYFIEEMATTLHRAVSMPEEEQRERMVNLRELVRELNVYRWAGRMLIDAARLRRRERFATRVGDNGGA